MKRITFLLVFLLIFTTLSACGGSSSSSGTAEPSSPSGETSTESGSGNAPQTPNPNYNPASGADLDRDITIVQAIDMVSWDPVNTSDLSNGYVINNVYSKLFTFDNDLNGIPEMTKDYSRINDNEWHFTIFDNITTHDGMNLTADDVVYSLNRTKEGTAIGALFAPVEAITKVDDYTISITTNGPYPALPTALTHQSTCIVPKHYAEKAEADGDWAHPVGTGRYTFESRLIGDNIKLNRYDNYFNPSDKALNKSLTFKVIPEGSSRTIAIETGTADLNVDFSTVDYDRAVTNPNLQLWQHYSQTVWHLGMNCMNENFLNPLVRQAVSFAIDREACLIVGHNGHGTVMYNSSTVAPTCLGAVDNPLNMYSYNPEKAKELMAQAGMADGFDTEIIVFRDEAERIATAIQAYLAEINIRAQVTRIENAVFASYIADHKAPMYITSWGAYWDPDLFLARRFSEMGIGGVNRSWYLNDDLYELILEGRSSFDNTVRAETYKKIQEFMAPEAPEVDLYVSIMFALATQGLKGVDINVERPFNYYKLHY